jgi:hypothetical protein
MELIRMRVEESLRTQDPVVREAQLQARRLYPESPCKVAIMAFIRQHWIN